MLSLKGNMLALRFTKQVLQLVVEVYSTINHVLFFDHILQAQSDNRPSDFPSPQAKFLQGCWTAKNVVALLVRVKDRVSVLAESDLSGCGQSEEPVM